MSGRQWISSDWQSYVNSLMSIHHGLRGEQYQRIPDMKGDHGLEGVSTSGDGYQAYCDQDSLTHEDRVRKQKRKIREDLQKLAKHAEFWCEFLGECKLRRWYLVVPELADKEVVRYARSRGRALKKLGLPFLAHDFEVFVCTAEDFPHAVLMAREPRLPRRTPGLFDESDAVAFAIERPEFVQKMDHKIAKVLVGVEDAKRVDYRNKLLQWHLESSNYVADLEQKFPPMWEELESLIATTGKSLETEAALDASAPKARINRTKKDFSDAVKEQLPFIVLDDREVIVWGTVVRWLGECPLDFEGHCDD